MLSLNNNEIIQVIWDEINAFTPDEKQAEVKRVEKSQTDLVKFIHEELESTGVPYSEQFLQWVDLCMRGVKQASGETKVPKIKLEHLQETIERNEEEVGFDEIDDVCEASKNVLLEHIIDLIHHVDLQADDDNTHEFVEKESEMESLDSYEHAEYHDYEMEEEEGDEDDIIFRELYNAREDSPTEGRLSDKEEMVHTLFLIFKSIIDCLMDRMK